MKTVTITKKNRKWFKATINGYNCKILVDENSETLEPGEHTLELEDISVRTKYGTDLKFKLKASAEEQQEAGICTLSSEVYNANLHDRCLELNAQWDSTEKVWVFSGIVEDEVDALDAKYNSDKVTVELKFNEAVSASKASVYFCGYRLARAFGRDSGAKLGEGVALIAGTVTSGGSVKNWSTRIEAGTTLRLQLARDTLSDNTFSPDAVEVQTIA